MNIAAAPSPTVSPRDPCISGFGQRGSIDQRDGGAGMRDCEENADDILRNAAAHFEPACRHDRRSVEQMMRGHENRVMKIYEAYDQSLAQAWRRLIKQARGAARIHETVGASYEPKIQR